MVPTISGPSETVMVTARSATTSAGGMNALTETVAAWREIAAATRNPLVIPFPHPSWRNNGWLKPFHVYVVALPRYGVCTVKITAKAELINGKDGSAVEHLVFPTRIHAEAHVLQMLAQLRPWRLVAPDWWKLTAPTRCWLDTAPHSALRTGHEAQIVERALAPDRGHVGV